MTIQFSTSVRNARLDAIETTIGTSAVIQIRTGPPPANCAAASIGTLLVEFDLASDWASAAASGSKSLSSLPLSATSVAAGLAGHYRIFDSAKTTCHEQGVVSLVGMGGDMLVDNIDMASGQTVNITAASKTEPGA